MATYRNPEEIELNVLQACSGRALLTAHVSEKCRLNMAYARVYISRLVEQQLLTRTADGFKTTAKGFDYIKEREIFSELYSCNYKKTMERLLVVT